LLVVFIASPPFDAKNRRPPGAIKNGSRSGLLCVRSAYKTRSG
jgi:hypothetical protein